MTTADFAKRLIPMVASEHIDDLIGLMPQIPRPLQSEVAKHVQSLAKASILARVEVRDDGL